MATIAEPERPRIFAQRGPQELFLSSTADICVYGGAAGGGKSYALLLDPLRHLTKVPGFNGVIFRRTCPEIMNPGGLWDTSAELYGKVFGAKPRIGKMEWIFPPYGNKISFDHLQHEDTKLNWQGAQVTYFGFDELTHFTESSFLYIVLSRSRSACSIRSYARATCNPDPGWVRDFLAPWVAPDFDGKRAESGEARYFARINGERVWVERGYPNSKKIEFIKARVYDNPILIERNPDYIASLENLPTVERARLLLGDWNVRIDGLVYPDFERCLVDYGPSDINIGGIDFGFHNPFAAVWGCLDADDVLWITDCRYVARTTLPEHSAALPRGDIRWWCDPASPSDRAELRLADHDCVPCLHLGQKPVMNGIDRVTERMKTGRLKIVRSERTRPLLKELAMYCYDKEKLKEEPIKENDHACDALRYLCVGIDRGRAIPVTPITDDEINEQMKAQALAENDRRREEWEAARANPHNDRWWN